MSVLALQERLRALRRQIEPLPRDVYARPSSRVSGSVGEHVRHVLDHVRALLGARSATTLTYDARLRGTRIETDPACAVDELVRLCIALDDLDDVPFERAVSLQLVTERGGRTADVTSSLGRELAYVLQHTIHHSALVAVLLDRADVAVAAGFGYAPSTPLRA